MPAVSSSSTYNMNCTRYIPVGLSRDADVKLHGSTKGRTSVEAAVFVSNLTCVSVTESMGVRARRLARLVAVRRGISSGVDPLPAPSIVCCVST